MGAIINQKFTTDKANYDLLNDNATILEEIQLKGNRYFGINDDAYITASWSILLDATNSNGVLINNETVPQNFTSGIYIGGYQSLTKLVIEDTAISGILTINFD